MRRFATVVLTTGTLVLSTGTYAVTGAGAVTAAPAAHAAAPIKVAAVAASTKWKTKNGSSKLFKSAEASGTYSVNLDKITVHFQLKDKKKDGWSPAVQFATMEAWDIQDSGVYYVYSKGKKNGRSTVPDQGSVLQGPPIAPKPPNNPRHEKCTRCVHTKPKKPKKKVVSGPKDGKFTFKSKTTFTSKFNEYLFVREVLIRNKGKKYQFKNGPITVIFNSDKVTSSDARLASAQPTQASAVSGKLPKVDARRAGVPNDFVYYNSRKNPTRAGNRKGQLPYLDSWGWFRGRTIDGQWASEINVKMRDNIKDGRLAAVRLDFTNDDASQVQTTVVWNPQDINGRWAKLTLHNFLTGHLFYTACTGNPTKNPDGSLAFRLADCGQTLIAY